MEGAEIRERLKEKGYDTDNFSKATLDLIYHVMEIVENPVEPIKVEGRRLS